MLGYALLLIVCPCNTIILPRFPIGKIRKNVDSDQPHRHSDFNCSLRRLVILYCRVEDLYLCLVAQAVGTSLSE